MQDPDNLSALYRCAIKEDQRQKIRELDFGKSSSQASAQFDINAIKGSGCYKCGSNDHFIKDCPLNREKDSGSTDQNQNHRSKSHDENSMEKSIQAITDLLRSLLEQNKLSHTTMNKSTHRHSYTNTQTTSHHTNTPPTDLTNQTIGDTTIRANIGTIQESISLVNVPVMPLVALTNLIWRRIINLR